MENLVFNCRSTLLLAYAKTEEIVSTIQKSLTDAMLITQNVLVYVAQPKEIELALNLSLWVQM